MIVYESIKSDFLNNIVNDKIVDIVTNHYRTYFGNPGKGMVRSWKNSLEYMYKVLNDNDIPSDAGVAIEYNIPFTSKKIDFLITGKDKCEKSNIIIIELKQWESCEVIKNKDAVVKTFVGGGVRETNHPSYQAWSYASLIEDFNLSVQEQNIGIYPCGYLHNYVILDNDPLLDNVYEEYFSKAPLFGKGDVLKLREFIKKYVSIGDRSIIYTLENGKISPSKRLQDSITKMLKGNKEFTLIDDQKVVFENLKLITEQSFKDDKKRVVIVQGGPGTGKTILAINLLAKLINEKMVVNYISKNAAPRSVYFNKLKEHYKASYVKNLFKSSGIFTDVKSNVFDTLIVDEAHRLNAKSGMYKNKGFNQISEIINASKSSIFFIDESQRVTINDIGSISEIEHFADIHNAEIYKYKLESQFRCNGSDGYLSWLDNILQIRNTANFNGFNLKYDFKVFNNPNDLKEAIFKKNNHNNKSRLLAGYCWNWPKKDRDDTNYYDISIPESDFGMSWNLNNSDTWAIDEHSVREVGCIHTSQGLEFDYVGVIIGNDLRFEDGRIVTDFTKRAKTDTSLRGIKKLYKTDKYKANSIADEIIKNTYRTLMTRGQKGCYIYCCDKNLEDYIKRKLELFNK